MILLLLLASGLGLIAAGLLVGISDNLPGIALLYLGVAVLVTTLASRWRSERKFLFLVGGSVVCFVLLVLLENALAAASDSLDSPLGDLLGALGAVAFVLATVLCPVALIVGLAGGAVHKLRPAAPDRALRPADPGPQAKK